MDIQRKMRTPTWNETCSMAPCNSTVHMSTPEFKSYPKIPRYSREIIITEKIDGSNGQIYILRNDSIRSNDSFSEFKESPLSLAGLFGEDCNCGIAPGYYNIFAGSRNRWVTTDNDNFGFASWVKENAVELLKLGEGRHFGEWWGKGIQRGYGLDTKKFSLFNVNRWNSYNKPDCCEIIPVIYRGHWTMPEPDQDSAIEWALDKLQIEGSMAAPGYMNPEGIIIYHTAGNYFFKKTFMHDTSGKPE